MIKSDKVLWVAIFIALCMVWGIILAPTRYHVVKVTEDSPRGAQSYRIQYCNIGICHLMGYQFPVTPEGLQEAKKHQEWFVNFHGKKTIEVIK